MHRQGNNARRSLGVPGGSEGGHRKRRKRWLNHQHSWRPLPGPAENVCGAPQCPTSDDITRCSPPPRDSYIHPQNAAGRGESGERHRGSGGTGQRRGHGGSPQWSAPAPPAGWPPAPAGIVSPPIVGSPRTRRRHYPRATPATASQPPRSHPGGRGPVTVGRRTCPLRRRLAADSGSLAECA